MGTTRNHLASRPAVKGQTLRFLSGLDWLSSVGFRRNSVNKCISEDDICFINSEKTGGLLSRTEMKKNKEKQWKT